MLGLTILNTYIILSLCSRKIETSQEKAATVMNMGKLRSPSENCNQYIMYMGQGDSC
jgi:hypothetical protein